MSEISKPWFKYLKRVNTSCVYPFLIGVLLYPFTFAACPRLARELTNAFCVGNYLSKVVQGSLWTLSMLSLLRLFRIKIW